MVARTNVVDTPVFMTHETLTIRLPNHKAARLRQLARHRSLSVSKLVEELATISIAEFDAESRFRTFAARGSVKEGLAILDRLDAAFPAKRQ